MREAGARRVSVRPPFLALRDVRGSTRGGVPPRMIWGKRWRRHLRASGY